MQYKTAISIVFRTTNRPEVSFCLLLFLKACLATFHFKSHGQNHITDIFRPIQTYSYKFVEMISKYLFNVTWQKFR